MESDPRVSFSVTFLLECAKLLGLQIYDKLSHRIKSLKQDDDKVSEAVSRHLVEVVNWASRVQFFGVNSPEDTEQATIALALYTEPRRFQSSAHPNELKSETDLLSEPHHVLVLGEPGSGKTTTLKRIALTMLKEPAIETDTLQYPMVIRLRELSDQESLCGRLANIIGLTIKSQEVVVRQYVIPPPPAPGQSERKPYWDEIRSIVLKIGDDLLIQTQ